MSDQPKRVIDELFQEYDARTRDWLLDKLIQDIAGLEVTDLETYGNYRLCLEDLKLVLEGELVIPDHKKNESLRFICPKISLYYYLISPVTEAEDNPKLIDKFLTENISNIRRFLKELWPRRKKKRRMIEIERGWLERMDYQ